MLSASKDSHVPRSISMIRLFRHYVPRSLLMLAAIEVFIFLCSVYLGKSLRVLSYDMPQPEVQEVLPKALTFAIVMIGIMTAMGLYERNFLNGKVDMILRVGVSFLIGLLGITLIYYFFPSLYLGRGEFGLAFVLAFAGVITARYGFLQISDHDILKRRVLVLGTGKKATQVEQMAENSRSGIKIIGYISINEESEAVDPIKILTPKTSLYDFAEKERIDEILLAIDDRRKNLPLKEILECKISGVQVTDLVTFFERETGKLHLDALQPSSMIFSDGFHQAALKTTSKRVFDVVVAASLLLLTWPIIVLTALAIWIESGGRDPIFYCQERVGKNASLFKLIKFRSMQVNAEQDGVAQWAAVNDSRITRVGALIRKTRIDELPQLVNVILGHMSFVGPRPERPHFVEELSKSIPFYSIRHRVNPGITGWAQICYPYGASEEDAREKLQFDLYYIKNYSLFLDLMVLLQTAHVILWSKGAR